MKHPLSPLFPASRQRGPLSSGGAAVNGLMPTAAARRQRGTAVIMVARRCARSYGLPPACAPLPARGSASQRFARCAGARS